MDKIILTDLKIKAVIGIWEWEKRNPQIISIDLEMETDVNKASETDSIKDALDYKAVATRMKEFAQSNQFELIETLIEKMAQLILDEFKVQWLKLTISKPLAIRDSRNVGICIERSKHD
jgi:dihydroneopterin aldolase